MELTSEDFETLMEALDVWTEHGGSNELMAHLLMASMKHGDDIEAAASEVGDYTKIHKERKLTRKEQAIILKAKLVYFKRDVAMNQMFAPVKAE